MYLNLERLMIFLLVTLRMTGIFVFNPIFGRRNIPSMVRMGLAVTLGVCITSALTFPALPELSLVKFFFLALIELAVGFAAGFILNMFMSAMIVGGEIVDMQLGLGMAKNFDPGSNASVSITATMFNAMFVLTFFLTNNHLTLIYMTAQTYSLVPMGTMMTSPALLYYIPSLFGSVLLFAIKLCLPVVVLEVIITMAVGIIMRIIPQINIFVVNIQFKLLIGILALVILVVPFMAFIENMMIISYERIQDAWGLFVSAPQ